MNPRNSGFSFTSRWVVRTPAPSRCGKKLDQPVGRGVFVFRFHRSAEELSRSDSTSGLRVHLEQIRADADIVVEEHDEALAYLRQRGVEGLALVAGRLEEVSHVEACWRVPHDSLGAGPSPVLHHERSGKSLRSSAFSQRREGSREERLTFSSCDHDEDIHG